MTKFKPGDRVRHIKTNKIYIIKEKCACFRNCDFWIMMNDYVYHPIELTPVNTNPDLEAYLWEELR